VKSHLNLFFFFNAMKLSTLLPSLVILLPLLSQATGANVPLLPRRNGGKKGGNNNNGGNGGAGNATNGTTPTGNNSTISGGNAGNVTNAGGNAGNVTNIGGNAGNVTNVGGNSGNVTNVGGNSGNVTNVGGNTGNATNTGGNTGNATNAGGDPQTSLTLDPRVIAPGFANNGQNVPVAGQVASLTSTNNFINFCLTVPNLPLTNGQQIATGSCNPAPMGVIPSSSNMPSAKFTNPKNGDTIAANQAFTISMAINNLVTGNFVNAEQNYFAAPQQVGAQGSVQGHSHVVVEAMTSLTQTTPTNPKNFAFFKGLNNAAQGGILSAAVANGLPAGAYRLCSINTAANHQPVLVPIAQHGSLDDCVYFTATAGGAAGNNTTTPGGAAGNNSTTPAGAAGNNTTTPAGAAGNNTTTPAGAAGNNSTTPAGNTGASNSTTTGGNAGNTTTTTGGGKNAGNGKGGKAGGKRDVKERFRLY